MRRHSRNAMRTTKNHSTLLRPPYLKQKQQAPRLTWDVKGQYHAYNPTLKKCNLCLNEKLVIIDDPDKNLLNKRSEVISPNLHRNKFKLVNLTSRERTNDVI